MEAPQEAEVDFSEVFSGDKIAYNAKALNYCRVFVAIISGCAAGILGQTGLLGFLTFFIALPLLVLIRADASVTWSWGAVLAPVWLLNLLYIVTLAWRLTSRDSGIAFIDSGC